MLYKNDQMKIILHEGEVENVSCSFKAPIQTAEISKFESKNNIKLPKDYKAFMTLHNGARIYDLIEDGINIGGDHHLFSLDKIEEILEVEYISEQAFLSHIYWKIVILY